MILLNKTLVSRRCACLCAPPGAAPLQQHGGER
jgi:hypothetical protein